MPDCIDKTTLLNGAEKFYAYARERYQILLNRRAGKPREEWTQDPVLQQFRFTNVFREDDATTIFFKDKVREPLRSQPEVILATIACRWFNRINAIEVIAPFILERNWDFDQWQVALEERKKQDGVIVTGAYIIKTPARLTKIEALLFLIEKAKKQEEAIIKNIYYDLSLEFAWQTIMQLPYQGQFTANEVVMDLYNTDILMDAVDALTWTNPGPGCTSGLGALFYNDRKKFDRYKEEDRQYMVALMRELLELSRDSNYWPQEWPQWNTLHTVQFNMCEMDKYIRGQKGMKLKRKYHAKEL